MADLKMADLKMAGLKMAGSILSVSTLGLFREGWPLLGCSMPCFPDSRKKKTVTRRFSEAVHIFYRTASLDEKSFLLHSTEYCTKLFVSLTDL